MPKLLKILFFSLPIIIFISVFINAERSFAYTTNDVYFKEAYNFYKIGNCKKAESLFWLYTLKGRLLVSYSLYYQGVCFVKLKDYRKADFVLSKLISKYRNFVFYKNAVSYLALSEKKNGYSYSSIRHFKYVVKHTTALSARSNAIFQIAKIYLNLKHYAKARSYLLLLYIHYPYFSQKHNVGAMLKHIPNFSGVYLSKSQRIERASALYYSSYYTKAWNLLLGIKSKKTTFMRINILLKTKKPLCLKDINKLLRQDGEGRVYGESLKLLYLQAYYYYYVLHKQNKALKRLKFILREKGHLNKQGMLIYRSIVWHSFLAELRSGEIIKARESIELLLNKRESYRNNAKYLFWYGIVLKKLGMINKASFYFDIAKNAPVFSYYAMMSRIEMKTPLELNKHKKLDFRKFLISFDKILRQNSYLRILLERFKVLSNLKIQLLANIEAQNIIGQIKILTKHNGSLKYATLMSAIYIMDKYGNYGYASKIATILLYGSNGRLLAKNMNFLRLAYPKPYFFYVNRYANRYDIPGNLIYAVMRQESFYDPSSFSSANAIGLMQIIPTTGYYIADKVGHYDFNPSMLYSKNINIKFGSYYLKTLLNRFGNKKYLAVASYNAGPDVVGYWKDSLFKRDNMLLFIESIPFSQTRNYVKKVLRNYYLYNAIY